MVEIAVGPLVSLSPPRCSSPQLAVASPCKGLSHHWTSFLCSGREGSFCLGPAFADVVWGFVFFSFTPFGFLSSSCLQLTHSTKLEFWRETGMLDSPHPTRGGSKSCLWSFPSCLFLLCPLSIYLFYLCGCVCMCMCVGHTFLCMLVESRGQPWVLFHLFFF